MAAKASSSGPASKPSGSGKPAHGHGHEHGHGHAKSGAGKPSSATSGSARSYRVVRGDTLSKIAEKYYGHASEWPKIAAANNIKSPFLIPIGINLRIPAGTASPNNVEMSQAAEAEAIKALERGFATLTKLNNQSRIGPKPLAAKPHKGGDSAATEYKWPLCKVSVTGERVIQDDPVAKVVLKYTGGLNYERKGSFACEGNINLDRNLLTQRVKTEYGNHIVKVLSEVKMEGPLTNPTLNFKAGWKFKNGVGMSVQGAVPPTFEFTFAETPIHSGDLKGTLKIVAEVQPRDGSSKPQSLLAPVPVLQRSRAPAPLKVDIEPDLRPTVTTVGGAMALWYAIQSVDWAAAAAAAGETLAEAAPLLAL